MTHEINSEGSRWLLRHDGEIWRVSEWCHGAWTFVASIRLGAHADPERVLREIWA